MNLSKNDLDNMPPKIRAQIEKAMGGKPEKRTKYNNQKTIMGGKVFDSIKEAERYADLQMLLLKGLIEDLRCQVPYHVSEKVTYVADFVYLDVEKGQYVVEDAKGVRTPEYRIKAKLFKEKYRFAILET